MMHRRRGVLAALFLTGTVAVSPAFSAPANATELAPGETVLSDGLTTQVRHATASGAVALEVWIRCPANGWSSLQPGIARLTALALIGAKSGGSSLRDAVRMQGGQLSISVFQTATEIAILAPSQAAPRLQDELMRRVFHPAIDAQALSDAKVRLAEEQAAAAQSTPEVLRDGVFAALFSGGPLRDSTFGDTQALKAATLADVRDFAARAYAGANAAVIALGNGDPATLAMHLAANAPPPSSATTLPSSPSGSAPAAPVAIASTLADVPGVALAWTGPPIADQRAATAMDFLSDYLADQHAGLFARAALAVNRDAAINGQFVTLENPGVFFVSATGPNVDPGAMGNALRSALAPVLARPLPASDFARALSAYETRLLRQMDSPQGLADNYGWYFAQGAPSYAPSATDANLGGAYFGNAASLTADYVRDVARKYLGAAPVIITLVPNRPPLKVSPGGS
jgi:predicted Zn-dependent peptidase